MCNVKHNSNDGKKLKEIQIIIWDEIPMTSKFAFKQLTAFFKIYAMSKKFLVVKLYMFQEVLGKYYQLLGMLVALKLLRIRSSPVIYGQILYA